MIVTTRRGGFAALGRVMELDVIDLPSAVALLRTRVPDLDEDVAQEIAGELGRLPLALEQAAAYLDRSAMPPGTTWACCASRAADLYARGQVSGRHDTIATLWDIALERISREDPAAVVLLELCAYLAPEPIPLDLFSLACRPAALSRCRRLPPTSWPSTRSSGPWSITRWLSGRSRACSCTGSCRASSAPGTPTRPAARQREVTA